MKVKTLLLVIISVFGFNVFGQKDYYTDYSELRPQVNDKDYSLFLENLEHASIEQQYQTLDSLADINFKNKKFVDYLFYKNQLATWYFDHNEYNKTIKTIIHSRKDFAANYDTLHIEYLKSFELQAAVYELHNEINAVSLEEILLQHLTLVKALGYENLTLKNNPYIKSIESLASHYRDIRNYESFFHYVELLHNKCKQINYLGGISRADGYVNELIYMADDLYDILILSLELWVNKLENDLNNPKLIREQTAYLINCYQLGSQNYRYGRFDKSLYYFNIVGSQQWKASSAAHIILSNIKMIWCYNKLNDTINSNKQLEKCLELIKSKDVKEINQAFLYLSLAEGISSYRPDLSHTLFDSSLAIYKKYNGHHRPMCAKLMLYHHQVKINEIIALTKANFPFDTITQTFKINAHIDNYPIYMVWNQILMETYYKFWEETGQSTYLADYENYLIKIINLLKDSFQPELRSHHSNQALAFFNLVIDNYVLYPFTNEKNLKRVTDKTIIDAISLSKQNAIANSAMRLSDINNEENNEELKSYLNNINAIQKHHLYLNSIADSLVTDDDLWLLSDLLFENAKYRYEIKKINIPESNNSIQLANIEQVQELLSDEQVVLDFFETDSLIFCSVISNDTAFITYSNSQKFKTLTNHFIRGIKTGKDENLANQELSQLLLTNIKPAIENKTKLIIIPHKWLHNIPFEALIYSASTGEKLIDKYSISYNYSYQIWAANQNKPETKEQSLLAIAPVFNKINNQALKNNDTLLLANSYRGDAELSPLPFSEKELKQIQKTFKQNKLQNKLLVTSDATEQNFYSNYSNYSIIHFATHGLSNKEYFERSGLFFYQKDSNNNTAADSDNFISLGEIYTLNKQPDLVVLSACKTGTGKIVEGEGVMALPRGFIYAGVPNVIASLWKVHDEKTKDLMVAFYKHLLEDKVSYAEALRLAKLDCIGKGFLPMDWAGFVLIGN